MDSLGSKVNTDIREKRAFQAHSSPINTLIWPNFSELIDHEEVIKQLEADTISFSGRVGVGGSKFLCGTYPQMVQVELKVIFSEFKIFF